MKSLFMILCFVGLTSVAQAYEPVELTITSKTYPSIVTFLLEDADKTIDIPCGHGCSFLVQDEMELKFKTGKYAGVSHSYKVIGIFISVTRNNEVSALDSETAVVDINVEDRGTSRRKLELYANDMAFQTSILQEKDDDTDEVSPASSVMLPMTKANAKDPFIQFELEIVAGDPAK